MDEKMTTSLLRFSGKSFTSRITCGIDEEPNYEDMSDKELKEYLEMKIRINNIISLENDVFEHYLQSNDSQSLISMGQVLETAKTISSQMALPHISSSHHHRISESVGGFSMRGKFMSMSFNSIDSNHTFVGNRSGVQSSLQGLRIKLSQRIEMANKVIDELRNDIERDNKRRIMKRENICAQINEIQMRIRDINKSRDEFEDNVVKKGIDPLTGKISSEKFIKYIEMWIKNSDRIIDKLQLKCSTIKSKIKMAKIQLQQRDELGDRLHLIDFQALEIENENYKKQIDTKTEQMIKLKNISGQYNYKLNIAKDKLDRQQAILNDIKMKINIKENKIAKLNFNINNTDDKLKLIEKRTNKITKSIDNNAMSLSSSNVAEIIKTKSEVEDMKKTYAHLMRQRR